MSISPPAQLCSRETREASVGCEHSALRLTLVLYADGQETKDLETTVAGIRADKVKAEAAEKAAKAKGGQPCNWGLPQLWWLASAFVNLPWQEASCRLPQ